MLSKEERIKRSVEFQAASLFGGEPSLGKVGPHLTSDIAAFDQLRPHHRAASSRVLSPGDALGRCIIRELITTSGPGGQVVHDPKAEMDSLRTRFILSIPFMIIGFMLTRAPFMMTSITPSKPWADGPLKLVATPQFETKKVKGERTSVLPACRC
jgi:hypothetical protein